MKKQGGITWLLAGGFLGACIVTGCGLLTHRTGGIENVPPPVKTAIERETSGGLVREVLETRHGDVTVYKVAYVRNGKKTVVGFAKDGAVMKCCQCCEESWTFTKDGDVSLAQTPVVVKAAIEKEVSGGSVEVLEKGSCGSIAAYKVAYTRDGRRTEVEFTEDGVVMKCWNCSKTEPVKL